MKMKMINELLNENKKIVISTGNVLNVNKKAGQKPTEELIDCLKVTLSDDERSVTGNYVSRVNNELEKVQEHERCNIKIGAKIFLNVNCGYLLEDAIKNLFSTLKIDYIDNIILSFYVGDSLANSAANEITGANDIEEENRKKKRMSDLKTLWTTFESYGASKQIGQLGISDLDVDSLQDLYNNCKITPTIAQINLNTCCVVPPALQEFCASKDIQLLTHSDPEEILPKSALRELGIDNAVVTWTIRYQVHVKCRGLLTAKGFIAGVEKD